ncbi:hypothetical protein CK203_093831 [Vitis vinifera]|uniref:Transmembrane protein n=1 Tax=Vitis vinifera TaxID=29760 RepID=A0A438EQ91_VITVI|nr:hypothetical protein CK203_093831 [Vitis vinifera]
MTARVAGCRRQWQPTALSSLRPWFSTIATAFFSLGDVERERKREKEGRERREEEIADRREEEIADRREVNCPKDTSDCWYEEQDTWAVRNSALGTWVFSVAGALLAIPVGIKRKSLAPLVFFGTTGTMVDIIMGISACEREHAERQMKLLEDQNSAAES